MPFTWIEAKRAAIEIFNLGLSRKDIHTEKFRYVSGAARFADILTEIGIFAWSALGEKMPIAAGCFPISKETFLLF